MAIKYHLNKTLNIELELPCQKCSGKTSHRALATVDVRGSEGDHDRSFDWSIDHQIVQCLGCKSISFRIASSNSEDYYPISDDEYEYDVLEKLYPPRIEGRKGLGVDAVYLPANVKPMYEETLTALSVQAPRLSAIGLRALIEAICREKEAKGGDLLQRIDNLVEQRVLTPAGATILHKIRALGNAAAHEAKPHNERQLALAMDIVEHMLKDVYILPTKAELEYKGDT